MTRTRFAPSPTGPLHIGHAYAAKVAHELARNSEGHFLLRFEDIDRTRVREEFYSAIEEDMKWLGFSWDDEPLRQSNRLTAYNDALALLEQRRMIYPCFCTRREIEEEISRIASAPQGPEGPLYPGTCRNLTPEDRSERLNSGQIPALRLDANAAARATGELTFSDRRLGNHVVNPHLLGDVILARKDIGTSYHLAVVVDDAMQGITLVTRGDDLLPSTHVHRMLQALLSLPEPEYLHHRLICDDQGRRLAKRDKDRSLHNLRESGVSSAEIIASFPNEPSIQTRGIAKEL